MGIKLSDNKGRFYQLTRNRQPAPLKKTDEPVIDSVLDAQQFLKSIKAPRPTFWREVWKQTNPLESGTLSDKQIIGKLAKMLSSEQLYIFVHQNNIPKPALKKDTAKVAINGNKGAAGGSAAILGSALTDKSVAGISPSAPQPEPSDKNAVERTTPSEVGDKPTTGTACYSETETRGCPISMVSGEEVLPLTDFILPGPMSFVWKRFYRTGHSLDNGLGHGWTHSASEQLTIEGQQVIVSDEEGRHLSFALPALYQRSKLINEGLNLDYIGKDCFVLKQDGPDGNRGDKVFTRLGDGNRFRLSQLRHPAYRPLHKDLHGDRDPEQGFCIDLHYDANNHLIRLQGNWGKSLKLNRNAQGRINRVQLINELTNTQKTVAEYDYDKHGDLVAQRNAAGLGETYQYSNHMITQRTLITGFSYYYEWDQLNNQARCLRNWGDKGIYNFHFKWDPDNNTSYATDSRGYTTTFVYNEFGQIIEETDPEGGVHRYEYERGRKTKYTNPQGHSSTFYFDAENHATGTKDSLGHYQTFSYFRGKPTEFKDKDGALWTRNYSLQGELQSLTDPYDRQTHYQHHKNGLLSQVTDPQGRVTKYNWNTPGELIRITDFNGHQQQLKYNDLGQVNERHVLLKGQSNASITRYHYTVTGQLEKVIAPNGDITNYQYNENSQLIQHSDPQGRVTRFEYDGLSQIIKRTDASGYTLTYQYDKERNLTGLINENGETYRFEYDGCERLIKETGFDGRVQKYTYNKAGHLIQHQDGECVITEFERDALGQMVTKTCRHINNEQPEERSRYQYDPKGRLVETYNQHQFLKFEFDLLGNLKKEQRSNINNKNQIISASKADINYIIQWPNRRSQIQLPDGQKIDYIYSTDKKQALEKIQLNNKTITEIQRDSIGREIQRTQGNTTTLTEYDPMGRLQKQQAFNLARKQKIIQREYAYDNFGNLSQFTNNNSETRYVYDLLNRLEKTEGTIEEQFDFDPAGNILGMNERSDKSKTANTRVNIKGNRLTLQGDRKFSYDECGNLIKESRGKGGKLETLFEYNLQNQLIKVTKHKQTTEYKYDPLGRRIEKKDNFGTTSYLWAGDQLAQESRNKIKKTYIYEPLSFKPVALVQDGEVYHYHLDHLGTPRELTNHAGDIVWKVRYKTYGNVALKECEEIENNLRFQGQYFDEETGLHYNRHRYYNPNTGQFINQDPIGLLGGINNYQYAPNPTGWIDPFGLCKESVKPTKNKEGRKIQYFSKDEIKYRRNYDGEEYEFYLGDIYDKPLALAYTSVNPEEKSLQFYISNRFNEGTILKGEDFGITNEILTQSIAIYTKDFGEAPEFLNGSIIKKNLSNFQEEYAKISELHPDASVKSISEMAIKKISFGKERVKLGYSNISVDAQAFKTVSVNGKTLKKVPTKVKIKASKPETKK